MRFIVIAALILNLSACVVAPKRPQIPGGQRLSLPGISFVAPQIKSWSVMVQSTYQVTLGARAKNPNETLIASVSTFQIPTFSSPKNFLDFVKSGRAAEPKTGRFEVIKNEEKLYTERTETCVKHEAKSKDYGAKRGNSYTVVQYFGMNCIHPKNSTVGILVEFSRKAPPGIEFPQFKTLGSQLLKSVEFSAYK